MINPVRSAPKKKGTTGSCSFHSFSPSNEITSLSFQLPFEEALKLNIAIDEAVRQLNRLNRARKEARDLGVTIIFHQDIHRVVVTTDKLSG
ncbi:MAG: hypothetical protein KGH68_02050, partial [Patescibacteria group bacterium]|nr:hypothetical protein [Patescibacteria group bacterium]